MPACNVLLICGVLNLRAILPAAAGTTPNPPVY